MIMKNKYIFLLFLSVFGVFVFSPLEAVANVAGYQGYYNFFNIEAYQSGSMDAISRGLWYASQSGSYA